MLNDPNNVMVMIQVRVRVIDSVSLTIQDAREAVSAHIIFVFPPRRR